MCIQIYIYIYIYICIYIYIVFNIAPVILVIIMTTATRGISVFFIEGTRPHWLGECRRACPVEQPAQRPAQRAQYPLIKEYTLNYWGLNVGLSRCGC